MFGRTLPINLATLLLWLPAMCTAACPVAAGPIAFSVPISYGEQDPLGDPMVAARLGDAEAKWIIDTGTYPIAVLRGVYPRVAGLPADAPPLDETMLSIDGANYRIFPLQVLDAPEGVFAPEVGGLLSPQAVSRRHYLVLDLDADCFVGISATTRTIWQRLGRLYPTLKFATVPWIGTQEGVLFVEGSYESGEPTTLDIDTGRRYSAFDAGYLGPVESIEHGSRSNALGVRREVRQTLGGVIRVTERFPKRLPVDIRPDDAKRQAGGIPWRGSLGIDYLKGLVLVIPPKGSPAIFIAATGTRH